ncbi:MAG: hypothetical protein JWN25_1445 [Verrucomicrobiales bacterium]|nr:hypothetical protein [Verrucomicrobiales bacterium]MDB6129418.1 hypothetical protein [Verrucomicrobiales bacterium]
MRNLASKIIFLLLTVILVTNAGAQFGGGGRRGPSTIDGPIDRGSVPEWSVDQRFPTDLFTFARLKYRSTGRERSSYAWWTDYPNADLNFCFRLQQMTSIKVNMQPRILEINNPQLFDFPWIFMSGAGNIILSDEEALVLRKYFKSGGFMMVDDFWGQAEWNGVARALKKVFPDRDPVDLRRNHAIFKYPFNIPDDRPLQTPNIFSAIRNKNTGVTWEDDHAGGNTRQVHYRAIFDDKGRMMVMLCHNTDNGDGWEEETSDPWFFKEFSENKNFPLGINIIFYSMTH